MAESPSHYVALGDSISIDDYSGGPGCGGASLLFANRDGDFPDWRGRDLRTTESGAVFSLLATDGATTRTFLDLQLPRLAALHVRPTLVTLTIGGNDLLGAYGDSRAAREVIARVEAALDRALPEVAGILGPAGRIVLGTVYDPSDGTGDAGELGLPPWPDGVAMIDELNRTLHEVAARHGVVTAEIAEHFRGHGLLAGTRRAGSHDRPIGSCGSATSSSPMPGEQAACGRHSGRRSTATAPSRVTPARPPTATEPPRGRASWASRARARRGARDGGPAGLVGRCSSP
jgi:lysophospholipase L1-like esterase